MTTKIRPSVEASLEIDVSTTGARSPVTITEVSTSRALRDELGLEPPHGYIAEPLPWSAQEQKDPDAVAHAKEFNRDTVRVVGGMAVPPNGSSVLVFKVAQKRATRQIDLRFERKIGMGGSITSGSVKLNAETH